FYRWAAKNQEASGGWPQRQYTDGSLAPVWGSQIDETGTILWGMYQYCKETWDLELMGELWPAVFIAAGYLQDSLNPDNGLPGLSFDLWEERFGEHAYSSAAVYAGLKGAGLMAKALYESELAVEWLETAKSLQEKIAQYFWDEELQRFIRSGWIRVGQEDYLARKQAGNPVKEFTNSKGYTRYLVFGDTEPDASLFGLAVPFGLLTPDDARMKKTVDNLVETLTDKNIGGIGRYRNDCYVGGNPWVITTLWAGLYEGSAGHWDKALARLKWTLDHQTGLGLLPEQVHTKTGEPAWAVPLAWSHAMFILLSIMLTEAQKL
ncbi:MAG TPA: glycoside hydrolase family 15 protein, partial [Verrucomicrobiae bacterium]|nr:glycoside hydrolase family 15 protein [Verrucomicrobiae bacterium]